MSYHNGIVIGFINLGRSCCGRGDLGKVPASRCCDNDARLALGPILGRERVNSSGFVIDIFANVSVAIGSFSIDAVLALLHAVNIRPLIGVSVWPCCIASTMLLVVLELTFVGAIVCIHDLSVPVPLVVSPVPLVGSSLRVGHLAVAIFHPVSPLTGIDVAIAGIMPSLTMLPVVHEVANVKPAIGPGVSTSTGSDIVDEVTLINITVSPLLSTFAMSSSVLPLTFINQAVVQF